MECDDTLKISIALGVITWTKNGSTASETVYCIRKTKLSVNQRNCL